MVNNASLALKIAERDYKNVSALFADSVATLEQLENVEVQVQNAKNQVEAAQKGLAFNEQNMEVANFNLKHSKIIAPSSGVILKKLAESNEVTAPGTPYYFTGLEGKGPSGESEHYG